MSDYDAVIVGAGPNGLAAAITLARAGCSVLVVEAKETVGGGTRSLELTLPGYIHDICSAVHPLGVSSPFFRSLPIEIAWCYPQVELAHPLDDGSAVAVRRSVEETAAGLGVDDPVYRRLMAPLVTKYERVLHEFLGPLRFPRYPFALAEVGVRALPPAKTLANVLFREERTKAMFAGMAGHSIMPLERLATSAFGIMLTMLAHAVGWPVAQGGSQRIADALAGYLQSLNGQIETGRLVTSLDELPSARAYLLDVTPRQLVEIAGDRLPARYKRRLSRYRYGPGVFKVDYALDGPVPWRAEACHQSATVHVGGTLAEIVASERAAWRGEHVERPFVLLAQQTVVDSTRAPEGHHTVWAYCHVPHGSTVDMSAHITAQIERFAPGFRDRIIAQSTRDTAAIHRYNPNYIGGDINGGVQDLGQIFTRPVARFSPYTTPDPNVYLCSSSTPPGGGVHGMCGQYAAQVALRRM